MKDEICFLSLKCIVFCLLDSQFVQDGTEMGVKVEFSCVDVVIVLHCLKATSDKYLVRLSLKSIGQAAFNHRIVSHHSIYYA